jgi:hypothetical protein
MPKASMSRIKTAICARLAASATRFRSRMKVSVPGDLGACGAGGTKLPAVGDCCAEVPLEPEAEERPADVIGAFIVMGISWWRLK